jgi:hypothetical protein
MVTDTVSGVSLGSKTPIVICHTSTGIAKSYIPFVSIGVPVRSFPLQKKLFRMLLRDSMN